MLEKLVNKIMDQEPEELFKYFLKFWIAWALLIVLGVAGIGVVAIHFILKFW